MWILTVAMVVRLGLPTLIPSLIQDSDDLTLRYEPIAESVLRGDGFQLDGHPTAMAPPGFPLFVAAVRALWGSAPGAVRVPLLILDALTVILVLGVGWIALERRVGIIAGILAALCPYSVYPVLIATSDTLFLFTHTAALLLLALLVDRPSAPLALAAGVLFGAATLVRAVPLLLPPALGVVLVLVLRQPLRRKVAVAAVLVAAFVATLAPWTVRNAIRFGGFVPVQHLGGYHLYMGTFDNGWGEFRRSVDRINREAGTPTAADPQFVRGTIQRISRDPGGYLRLVGRRLIDMWTATCSGSYRVQLALANGALLLAAAGGVVARRHRMRTLLPLVLVPIYYMALHSVLYALFRYMLPVLPVLLVLAAAAGVSASRWLPVGTPAWEATHAVAHTPSDTDGRHAE